MPAWSDTLRHTYQEQLAALTLEQKVTLLTGGSAFSLAPATEIGLDTINLSDGPGGVRGPDYPGGQAVTLFPSATLLGASWNEELAYEVGSLLAEEARVQHVHVVLGPTINLHRSLLGGRVFEAYSEDPLLTGRLAAAYVRGLQDHGVGACLKHLVGNESETSRNTVNSVMSEKTLRELYLLPFEIAARDAEAWSMMAAYNGVNGVTSTENGHVSNDIVKGEWEWSGLIMSDWFATTTAEAAANGGLDLVMPGPLGPWGRALVEAVTSGAVPETTVDDHVARVLHLGARVGALDCETAPPAAAVPEPDSLTRQDQLTRIAASAMTVLTNVDDVLPLSRATRVALIGRHATETIGMGGGSAQVTPPYQVSIETGFREAGFQQFTTTDGVPVRTKATDASVPYLHQPDTDLPGVQVQFLAEDGRVLATRASATPMTYIDMDDVFDDYVHTIVFRTRTQIRGAVEVGLIGAGDWVVKAAGTTTQLELRAAGIGYGEKILAPQAGSIVTHVDDSGFVTATLSLEEQAGMRRADRTEALADARELLYGAGAFGLTVIPAPRSTQDVITDAVTAAREADVAVVVIGTTDEQETEALDKTTLRLPGAQDELVGAVAGVARRTVVVLNSGTPMLMPWRNDVDAILWAGIGGQEVGRAVAAALLGEIEPAGRLATSFPVDDGAAPAWNVTPVEGDIRYDEGTFIGHRGHDAGLAPAPAFWFGHGLGYTTWRYDDAELVLGDAPTVSVTITNTGRRAGRETVQLYFRPEAANEPVRLVGWSSSTLEPGNSERVQVAADGRLFRSWNDQEARWSTLPSRGVFVLARGLGDVRATLEAR